MKYVKPATFPYYFEDLDTQQRESFTKRFYELWKKCFNFPTDESPDIACPWGCPWIYTPSSFVADPDEWFIHCAGDIIKEKLREA